MEQVPHHELRMLARSLSAAGDDRIMRVVATVDALAKRGAADRIVAPLRPRLAELRPPRPLRFIRLLFLPLDPLIVPAARWRPGSATVPRTALGPIAATVRTALGPVAGTIDAAIAGRSVGDMEIVEEAGGMLWPRAGAVLATAPALAGWADTGLPAATAAGLCRAVGAVLLAAVPLRGLAAEAEAGVTLESGPVHAVLAEAATGGSEALAMAVAVLLAWRPQAAGLLPHGASVLGPDGPALMRLAAGQATEVLLERLEAQGGTESLAAAGRLDDAGTEVRRAATLLEALDEAGPPERRRRLAAIRQRLEQSCRSRFSSGLENGVAAPLKAMGPSPAQEELADVENTARGLRQLESAARKLGGGAFYDQLLHDAVAAVRASPADGALGLADKVRLVEILASSDEADALLEEEAPAYQTQSVDPRLLSHAAPQSPRAP
jgi:hypothetical protein